MPFESTPGLAFTRATLQNELGVPADERGGDWSTGYTSFEGEYFVFCNIGTPGRTGHDYDNHWEGNTLIWRAKSGTHIRQPQIARMADGAQRVHVFYRYADRSAFLYAGLGRPVEVLDTAPVTVRWTFDEQLANPEVVLAVVNAGYTIEQVGAHTIRATLGEIVVYIKKSTTSFPLVIHPAWEERMTELKSAGGLRPGKRFYYHNSTMRRFPQRRHGGQGDIPYGLDFGFTSDEAVRSFVGLIKGDAPDTGAADQLPDVDPRTETEVTRAARLGQQQFRRDLLDKYEGRCVLTGINMPEVLRASHIKPWSKSTPRERRDVENGLLLAVHVDALFDKGLISFEDSGAILVSPQLPLNIRGAFGISDGFGLPQLSEPRRLCRRPQLVRSRVYDKQNDEQILS